MPFPVRELRAVCRQEDCSILRDLRELRRRHSILLRVLGWLSLGLGAGAVVLWLVREER